MKSTRSILATSCVALLTNAALAQDVFTWDGGGADGNWATGLNWAGDAAPNGNDELNFAGTTNLVTINNLTAGALNQYRILFNAGAGNFTLGGTGISLFDFGGNAPKLENNSLGSLQTISLPLTINGTGSGGAGEINPVDGDLTFTPTGTVNLAGTTQLRIFGNSGRTVTFNGIISGANTVAINQNSNVVYGAANSYTGDTFINAGSLSFAQGGSLSAVTGTLQLGDTTATGATATLRISDADGGTSIARPIVVRAGSAGTKTIAATNTSGTNTFSGTVALNTGVTTDVAAGGGLTLSGIVSGTGFGITKTGNGLLTLSGANTFTGGLTLNGGQTRLTVANTISGGITLNAGGTLEANTAGADTTVFNNFFGAAGNSFTFAGGTVLMNAATGANVDRTLTGRNVTVNAGGATFDIQGAYPSFVEGIFNQLRFFNTSVLSGSGTLTKNGGGRLQFQNGTATGFTGPVVINNGTVEAAGTGLGNSSVTNTITLNGGNFAVSGTTSQAIILNGGAISANGASRTLSGTATVSGGSFIFLNDFWRDFDGTTPTNSLSRNITISGAVSGSGGIAVVVNRPGYQWNNGAFILSNPSNTNSGTITVGKNLRLENNPTGGIGRTIGTGDIVLADGGLNLRDNGTASGTTLNYGNNVSVVAPTGMFNQGTLAGSIVIDVNRTGTGTFTNNIFKLGTLSIGSQTLNVSGGNGYGVEFGGAATVAGNMTFNATTASLIFSGGLTEDIGGRTLTKTGAGALTFTSQANYTGATTVNGSALTVSGSAGRLNGTPSLTLTGAALNIDNSAAIVTDRVPDAAPISLSNSSITFSSLAGVATNTGETLGAVTLASGSNVVTATQSNAGAIAALTLGSVTRQNFSVVRLNGTNLGQIGNSSRIILADQAADVPFLAPWITLNGTDFAQYVTASDGGFARGVTAVDYVTDPADDSGFLASQNLRLTGTTTTSLTADRAVNTVNFANAANTRTLDLAGNNLTLAGGGLIVGTNTAAITGGAGSGLTSGTSELIITNNAPLSIGVPIEDNAGSLAVTKVGAGTLTLSGASTFTGDFRFTQGTLSISDVANAGNASNLGAGGTLRLSDTAATTLQFTGASDATDRPLAIGAAGVTIDVTTGASNLAWNGTVGSTGSLTKIGAGTLTLGGSTNVTGITSVNVGTLGIGGTATLAGDFNVGHNGTNASVSSLSGGTLSVGSGSANSINIGGDSGAGSAANSTGTVNLSNLTNFTANVGNIRVGVNASTLAGIKTGSLVLAQNNLITATNSIVVGDNPNDGTNPGTRNITFGSGTNDVTTPILTIGGRKYNGTGSIAAGGTLILDNGAGRTALNVGTNTNIDTGTVPVASFDLSGGTITASLSNVAVGIRSGGGAAGKATGTLNLGTSATSNVNINVAAGIALRVGALDYSAGTQPTAETATGAVVIGGGTVSITSTVAASSAVVVGHFNNTVVAINGAAAVNSATGTLTINGGNVTITSAGTNNAINLAPLALFAGSVGTNTAVATLNINGGSLTVNNPIVGNSGTAGSTSTLNLTGGVLNMANRNISNINNLTFSGGTLRNLATLNSGLTQTGETSFLDVLANNTAIQGALAVTDGDINIAATRLLGTTGGTTVSGTGSIVVNGSLQGSLTVNTGATVSGSGTTQVLTLSGGTISPGNSPGILNTGNLSLGGGTVSYELNGTTAGTLYDQLNTTGTVAFAADTNLTLAIGYVPAVNDTFTLIANDAADLITGAGAGDVNSHFVFQGNELDQGELFTFGGYEFQINYAGGTNNNDVVLLTTVPEPGAVMSLLGGLGVLVGLRRFRGHSSARA